VRGFRITYAAVGVFILLLVLAVAVSSFRRPLTTASVPEGVLAALMFAGMAILAIHALGRAFYAVDLDGERLSVRFLQRRTYRRSQFAGFRRTVTAYRNGMWTRYRLIGAAGERDVSVLFSSNQQEAKDVRRFHEWVSALPDLDAADAEREVGVGTARITRRRARRIASALQSSGLLLLLLGILPVSLRIAVPPPWISAYSIAVCLLLPATLGVRLWRPEAFQFGDFVGARLPTSLSAATFFGGVLPLGTGLLFFRPLRWSDPVWRGLVVSVLLAVLIWQKTLHRADQSIGVLGIVAAAVIFYGYGAVATLNGALDRGRPILTTGIVLDRKEFGGRGHHYELTLEIQKPLPLQRSLTVPRDVYEKARIGDGLGLVAGPGALGFPWLAGVFGP
jgi:hypothetical protein